MIAKKYKALACLFLAMTILFKGFSQSEPTRSQKKKRILFILDASGSMIERWNGETKWNIAVQNLSNLIDSFSGTNNDVEIGIRLLGHQTEKAKMNCDDTKLELPFKSNYNSNTILNTISNFSPKGHTPLALALEKSAEDFTDSKNYENTIVLITDGIENCNGNPCMVAKKLTQQRIVISPYIIGLGIDSINFNSLECIGKFIDVRNKENFNKVVKTILKEVSTKTYLEINFIDSAKKNIYNVPYSLIDKQSGLDIDHYIRTNSLKPDPISISAQYQYNLMIHTVPPILIDTLSISYGKSNWIEIPIDVKNFAIVGYEKDGISTFYPLHNYMANYTIEGPVSTFHQSKFIEKSIFLSNPEQILEISKNNPELVVKPMGWLNLMFDNTNILAYIIREDLIWKKILKPKNSIQKIKLLPGNYTIVYKYKNAKIQQSKEKLITIHPNSNINIDLR